MFAIRIFTRGGWFFNEPRLELRQLGHPGDCLLNIPNLICVYHHAPLPADLLPNYGAAPNVIIDITADFDLEAAPAVRNALLAQVSQLLVGICRQEKANHILLSTGG